MTRKQCNLCGKPIAPHSHYVVRIEVFADPSAAPISADEIASADSESAIQDLLDEMKEMSAEELQDQVHRHFEFKICPACQPRFLVNPLGKPRGTGNAEN